MRQSISGMSRIPVKAQEIVAKSLTTSPFKEKQYDVASKT